MARVLTDAERGPLGAWAYNTRTLLQVSDVQVAERAGVSAPTIRKVEGGKSKPSARLLFEMARYYREVGERQRLPVEPPPGVTAEATTPPGDLATAIRELTTELRDSREERQRYEARLRAVEAELESLRAQPTGGASSRRPAPQVKAG